MNSYENELRAVVSALSDDYRENSLAFKAAEEIALLKAQRDNLLKTSKVLLEMHDAQVFVADPWNATFEELRSIIAKEAE
jgi:hypothetical protein